MLAYQMNEEQAKAALKQEDIANYGKYIQENNQGKGTKYAQILARLRNEATEAPAAPAASAGRVTPAAFQAANPGWESDMAKVQILMALYKAENEALKKSPHVGNISLKVSEKGALSAYGLGRFPVTLYKEQWTRLLAEAEAIKKFIAANPSLKTKGDA